MLNHTLRCPEKCHQICCEVGSAYRSVWQSHPAWRRWSHGWPWFSYWDWWQPGCIFCSSKSFVLLYEQLLIFLSSVHSTSRSICSPAQKNPRIWTATIFWPAKSASCFGITNRTPIKISQPDDNHPRSYSDCQSNIGRQHILLHRIWCYWGRWFDDSASCCWKNTWQRQVGYHWPEWYPANSSDLILL